MKLNDKYEIVFVYNADSGYLNALKDLASKTFSPASHQCRLCGLAYGVSGMKSEWKQFISMLLF